MDGIGLANWMREHASSSTVMICSGIDTRVDLSSTNPAIVQVISKPYMPDEIARMVVGLVNGGCDRA